MTTTDEESIAAVGDHHLRHGTTTMLASLVSAPPETLAAQAAAIASVVASGSPIVGSHLEGPWLDHDHRGAHDPGHLTLPDKNDAEAWVAAAGDTLRMVTMAPELPGAATVADLLEDAGVLVAFGHTGADTTTFGAALACRMTPLVTHLFNGMAPMHHRTPGAVGATLRALGQGGVTVELIADGVHLADETAALVFALDPGRHVVLVSDAMAAAGLPDGTFELGSLSVSVRDGQARTEGGSLAGGTAHLSDILRRSVTVAGVDPVVAVAAATSTPATLLGLPDRGALEPGLRADLVCLDDDWSVSRVMRGGRWVV